MTSSLQNYIVVKTNLDFAYILPILNICLEEVNSFLRSYLDPLVINQVLSDWRYSAIN